MSSKIEVVREGAVCWLRINRPKSLNALNKELIEALREALEAASADRSVRVIVLTGTGRAFSAGGDLKEFLSHLDGTCADEQDTVEVAIPLYDVLRSCPKPVIAAVNGLAAAGGFEMLLFCDVIFAAESARLGDAHVNYGLFPGGGGAAILPRRVGLNRAKSLLFSGELLPASTLKEWGLVHEVVPDEELQQVVAGYAASLAEKSPQIIRQMKAVANAAWDGTEELSLSHERLTLRRHMSSQEFKEGMKSFAEKRKPNFE